MDINIMPSAPPELVNTHTVEMASLMHSNGLAVPQNTNLPVHTSRFRYSGLKRKLHSTIAILGIVVFAVIITAAILFHKVVFLEHSLKSQSSPYIDTSSQFCLPCGNLKKTFLYHFRRQLQMTKYDNICCVKRNRFDDKSIILKAFVKKILADLNTGIPAAQSTESQRIPNVVKPALDVYFRNTGSSKRTSKIIDQWQTSGGPTINQGNVKVENGRDIIIPEDGNYFIYSKVQYILEPKNMSNAHSETDFIRMIIWRKDGISEEKLREGVNTRSVTKVHENEHERGTLSEMGTFYLSKNDRLYVELSIHAQLRSDRGSTYFGLYKL